MEDYDTSILDIKENLALGDFAKGNATMAYDPEIKGLQEEALKLKKQSELRPNFKDGGRQSQASDSSHAMNANSEYHTCTAL
eukprot:511115-Karenia_brevis.AAC.1